MELTDECRVEDFLTTSRAQCLSNLSFGAGRQLSIWTNQSDEVIYKNTKGHAFSLYLQDGTGTRRVDRQAKAGKPGAFSIFPEGHTSHWEITTPFVFFHLYTTDEWLRAAFARIHDLDARKLDLSEQTFVKPGRLENPLRHMADACRARDLLSADAGFSDLVAALWDRPIHLSGGLPPKTMRKLRDWAESNLDSTIRLHDLADCADLSEFYFHRMFRLTCGQSPSAWITNLRILRAKSLLLHESLADVSIACGFSSQSHLGLKFRQIVGVTPGQYRRLINL